MHLGGKLPYQAPTPGQKCKILLNIQCSGLSGGCHRQRLVTVLPNLDLSGTNNGTIWSHWKHRQGHGTLELLLCRVNTRLLASEKTQGQAARGSEAGRSTHSPEKIHPRQGLRILESLAGRRSSQAQSQFMRLGEVVVYSNGQISAKQDKV